MVAIEQKIENLCKEIEASVSVIIEGSDEHLDLILAFTKPLDNLSREFEKLNNLLFNNLNKYSDEQINVFIMPRLQQLNKSSATLIGAFRTFFLYRDIRFSLKNYTRQYDILREIIHDINSVRLAKDDEFDNILKELNKI